VETWFVPFSTDISSFSGLNISKSGTRFSRYNQYKMVEQTVNVDPDGSTTFEGAEGASDGFEGESFDEETMEEVVTGTDPAIYLLVAFVVGAILYLLYLRRSRSDEDDYFSSYEKVSVRVTTVVLFENISVIGTENSDCEME
jgi:hypothetical protein